MLPANRLFIQQLVLAKQQRNNTAPHYWPPCAVKSPLAGGFPNKVSIMRKACFACMTSSYHGMSISIPQWTWTGPVLTLFEQHWTDIGPVLVHCSMFTAIALTCTYAFEHQLNKSPHDSRNLLSRLERRGCPRHNLWGSNCTAPLQISCVSYAWLCNR